MGLLRFIKNWTLPVAIVSGAVVYFIFAYIPALDGAATFFAPVLDALLPVLMFFVLAVTFCKVDFKRLIPVKWHLWVTLCQVLFVALITAAMVGFGVEGKSLIIMEAILTCVSGPCATAAAVVTQKLGGDLEEMTTFTFISNFVTALLIPICFPIIDKSADMPFWSAFGEILYKVCIVLVAPMALAFFVKHYMKRLHRWVIGVKDLSYYLWGVNLMIVSGITVRNIVHAETSAAFIATIAVLSLVVCIALFATGRLIGRRFGNTVDAGQAFGQKNTAFSIWIASTYLTPLSTVGPGCYILWQNIINSIEIWMCRRNGTERTT